MEFGVLSPDQMNLYDERGYLHIPKIFGDFEIDAMERELDRLVAEWADTSSGWSGPWRQAYMDDETERVSKLTAMHDLHFYSEAWCRAVNSDTLTAAMSDLLGPDVELHHSTLHIKPPETGHPFPMHQDWAFYQHVDDRYIDVLVHLDDTCHANGEIRFLEGSQRGGALEHITQTPQGGCTPHLPTDCYRLEDSVPVAAQRGDVVCFNIHTVHGSHINSTAMPRRLVRFGYRHPENLQVAGQSTGRPGLMVRGQRRRREGQSLFSTAGPA